MRLLGEPEERYREDPVRMLRAVRFAAKLGFRFDPATEAPLLTLGDLLAEVPAARLFDESLKLFLSGHAVQSYELLRHYGLFRHLFPATDRALDQEENDSFRSLLLKALENTDERVASGQPVTPMFLLGVFLWQPAEKLAATLRESGDAPMQAMIEACDTVLRAQQQHVSIPRRFGTPMREMMVMQLRMRNQHGRRALQAGRAPAVSRRVRFPASARGRRRRDAGCLEFWERLESMDPEHRKAAVAPKRGERGPRRRPDGARRNPPEAVVRGALDPCLRRSRQQPRRAGQTDPGGLRGAVRA